MSLVELFLLLLKPLPVSFLLLFPILPVLSPPVLLKEVALAEAAPLLFLLLLLAHALFVHLLLLLEEIVDEIFRVLF